MLLERFFNEMVLGLRNIMKGYDQGLLHGGTPSNGLYGEAPLKEVPLSGYKHVKGYGFKQVTEQSKG